MNFTEDSVFTMPLTLKAHQIAQQFQQQQTNRQKAKQVYLNTLAVYAVHQYLSWLGIATDLEASGSWNSATQTLADIADLQVSGKGQLECRPVLPAQSICHVPAEVWLERIGFVAVQLDADLLEATLLGFLPAVATEEVPLEQLRSLDDLLEHLNALNPVESISRVNLGQWLQGVFAAGWQTAAAVLELRQPLLSFRNSTEYLSLTLRGKRLDLLVPEQIALLVGIVPIDADELDIWVRVCSQNATLQLPPELEVSVLDATGVVAMQAQARSTEMIQLKFSAVWGEQFSIKIALGDTSVTESFVV